MSWERPICCFCSKPLVYVNANSVNHNFNQNIYNIKSNGQLGKVIGETEVEFGKPSYTLCPSCNETFPTHTDEKGRIY